MKRRRHQFDKYHPITAHYVQKRIRSGYRYPMFKTKGRTVSHLQPEVKRIARDVFVIKAPYKNMFKHNIRFILIRYNDCWALLSDINESTIKQLLKVKYASKYTLVQHRYNDFVNHLMNRYQLNRTTDHMFRNVLLREEKNLGGRIYYIVISDYSIQSAYYRLIEFQIAYCGMADFLLFDIER